MAPLRRTGAPAGPRSDPIPEAPRPAPAKSAGFIAMALRTGPSVQRTPESADAPPLEAFAGNEAPGTTAAGFGSVEGAGPPPALEGAEESADGARIVEDHHQPLPGQLTKSEFLRRFGESLESGLSATLVGSGYTAHSCPTIAYWLGFASNLSASRLERGLRLYAGIKETPAGADGYLALLVARVQVGVAHWRDTGEVTGVPAEWEGQAAEQESAFIQSKAEGPRPAGAPDPRAVRGALGAGQPLPGAARGAMEARFGADFRHVRVHADGRAADLSRSLGARAFTVGPDVAFASGEFAPGTLRGDLLLAHELAHTLQQGSGVAERSSKGPGASDRRLERQADLAAAAAFAPELEGLAADHPGLDENALLKEAEGMPLEPGGGLRLQRCEGCSCNAPSPTPVPTPTPTPPWWEEPETRGDSTTLFCRPASKYRTLLDQLRQVDVSVMRAADEVLKMTPGTKRKEKYVVATVAFTQWTPTEVKDELKKILPMGGSRIVDDATIDMVKKVVSDYRAKHPNTFSVIQGIEAAKASNWPTSDPNCIATMNKAVSNLYGPQPIKQMSELGTTVQDSIDAVNAKGLVAEKKTFPAIYAGNATRYQVLAETDVTLSGAGQWMVDKVNGQEDGVHGFLLNICNGFHSVTILAMKGGGQVTLAWKDQISGIVVKTPDEVDKRIREMCKTRYRYWIRDKYIEKYKPTTPKDDLSYEMIRDRLTTDQLKALEDDVKASVNNDMSINTLAKLQPPKP